MVLILLEVLFKARSPFFKISYRPLLITVLAEFINH